MTVHLETPIGPDDRGRADAPITLVAHADTRSAAVERLRRR